jgi:predicted regulator of Ras-like GTPase activity (Roadblock/LC7/MglB family)
MSVYKHYTLKGTEDDACRSIKTSLLMLIKATSVTQVMVVGSDELIKKAREHEKDGVNPLASLTTSFLAAADMEFWYMKNVCEKPHYIQPR